jgi:hypothetical protein
MAQSLKQFHAKIQVMPSDAVKAIVLSWLNQSNGSLSDFERLITEITEESEGYQWGEIDTANEFQPRVRRTNHCNESRSLGRLPEKQDRHFGRSG